MPQPLYIYVHGFNSSPASYKAQQLQRWMEAQGQGERLRVPALSHWPRHAMATLRALVESDDRPTVLLGSSLGGYYATWLTEHYDHLKAVLINPSVRPFELLDRWLGENENIYTEERYLLTRDHLRQLQALHCPVLAASRYLLLVQTADEVLDYREATARFAASEQHIEEGGSHGFDQFERSWARIFRFAQDPDLAQAIERELTIDE
ncbi:YqiA/YcfP family alpha/beta fold hydrolase [Motiliproteus sediminis]|uniref:YqiA/YcfP family alpha/beta fold hydrolase n=1 Tax=Motiliproteus sediminis TaxID=1468178 RepID=UPI001AEFFFAF|nr:YqiA/YcfP family alpha/beta fold hydrolase [Motiliproteus sediminis]